MITLNIDQVEVVSLPTGTQEAMRLFSVFVNSLESVSHDEMRLYAKYFARQALRQGSLRPSIARAGQGGSALYSDDSRVETAGEKTINLAAANKQFCY